MYVQHDIYVHVQLPVTFNTILLAMVALVSLQMYTVLSSASVTLVITRSVNPPVVELNTCL